MTAFADCFDATTKWVGTKQAAQKRILASTIEEPDVVLIEAGIKRRFPSERLANGRTNYDSWTVAPLSATSPIFRLFLYLHVRYSDSPVYVVREIVFMFTLHCNVLLTV